MAAESPENSRERFPLIIDTHAHISMDVFSKDRNRVIERARAAGVSFIEVGFDVDSSRRSLALAESLGTSCAVGIHPHEAGPETEVPLKWRLVESLLASPRVKAIGEIGLDYYRDLSPRRSQITAFSQGLSLAKTKNLPVIIHQRDAEKDVLLILRSEKPNVPLIFHCFSQDRTYARSFLDLGGYLGIGGVATYPRNNVLREMLRFLPKDRILLETDCPYLPPQSKRGQRNEPQYIIEVVSVLAQVWRLTEEETAEITRRNALTVFKLKPEEVALKASASQAPSIGSPE